VVVCSEAQAATLFLEFSAPEESAYEFAHKRHACLPANEYHLIESRPFQMCVRQGTDAMGARAFDDVFGQVLQLGASESAAKTEGRRQKGQGDLDLCLRGEPDFGLLRGLAQTREHRQRLPATRMRRSCQQIRTARGFDFGGKKINNPFVEVITAQSRVAVGGEDLKDPFIDLENGEVKCAASQIVNRNFRVVLQF